MMQCFRPHYIFEDVKICRNPSFFILMQSQNQEYQAMKEEKRKSVMTILGSGPQNQEEARHFNQRKQTMKAEYKFAHFQSGSQGSNQFLRAVKRIGTKPVISSFHTHVDQPHSGNPSTENSRAKEMSNRAKAEKENTQVKQFRKKLKRVGKKVWVTAFKQSIDEQHQNEKEHKEQENNKQNASTRTDKYQFQQFQEEKKNRRQSREGVQTRQESKIVQEGLKLNLQQLSETHNIEIELQSEEKHSTVQIVQREEIDVDIDKMLEEIEIEHNLSKCTQKSQEKGVQLFTKVETINVKPQKRPSKFTMKRKQKEEKNYDDQILRKFGRKNTLERQQIQNQKEQLTEDEKKMIASKVLLKQSPLISASKMLFRPVYSIPQQKTKTMLSSDHQPRTTKSKEALSPCLMKQSSINSVQSMTNSKIQFTRPNLKQLKKEAAIKESHVSMHSSHKKEIGARKLGIQKFKNSEGEEVKITSSLKKNNKNLEMNWYIAEARKQITDNLWN